MLSDSCPANKEGKPVGAILKEAREAGGVSLDDAAQVTRIGKRYLIALEEGMFERLPSAVYVKGFLRIYAAYLKVPENEVLHAYEKNISDNCPCSDSQEPQPGKENIDKKNAVITGKRMYLVLAFFIMAAVLSYFFLTASISKNRGKEQSVAIPADAKPARTVAPPDKAAKSGTDMEHQKTPEENKEVRNEEVFDNPSLLPKGMVLKIKVLEDGWLDITIDDAISQHYELKSGDLIEWKGEKGFTLDMGNAGGVEAELDGKTLRPFGKSGESAHVLLKAGGYEN